jgi:hypothetical protein
VRKFAFNYPLLLLVLWTGLMLTADYVVINTSVRQMRSRDFACTTGKIVESALGRSAIRRRGVDFRYNYTVNGVDYTGHRYRYDDRNAAFEYEDAAKAFPNWSARTVYYDAANPEDSLLDPGLDGCDLLLLLFAVPLTIATIALWAAIIQARRDRRGVGLAGGVRVWQDPGETRARLAEFTPLAAGGFGLAAAAFVSAFPVVAIGGFAPTLRLMLIIWMFVLGAGMGTFFWAMARLRSGNYDLRVSAAANTVTLPRAGGRIAPLTVPLGEIVAVSLLERVSKNPSGNHFSYVPALERAAPNAEAQPIKLVSMGWSEARALAFSHWLSQQLQVRFKGIQAEPQPADGNL